MQTQRPQLERNVMQALTNEIPVRDLPGVRIRDVKTQPKDGFDVEFQLQSGQRRIHVYAEIKPAASPKLLEQLAPWIRRMRSLRNDAAFALICPFFGSSVASLLHRKWDRLPRLGREHFHQRSWRLYAATPRHACRTHRQDQRRAASHHQCLLRPLVANPPRFARTDQTENSHGNCERITNANRPNLAARS
jgi:hypothetical protein